MPYHWETGRGIAVFYKKNIRANFGTLLDKKYIIEKECFECFN
jgi:hypothetical protein